MTSILDAFVRTGWDVFGRDIVVGVDVALWQVVLIGAVLVGGVHYARRTDRIVRRERFPQIQYIGTDDESGRFERRILGWGPLRETFYGDDADETIERYELNQRLFYWGAGASMIVLFVSGYALLVPGSLGAAPLVSWLTWHVASSVALTALVASHIVIAPIRGDFWAMAPTRDDVRVAVRSLRRGAGRATEYPRFGKYSPTQQTLHWLTALSTLILIATGVILLRAISIPPVWDATRTPFGLSEAIKGLSITVHGVLAGVLLGILLLHVYFGLRRWEVSRSIFTGTISREAYEKYYDPTRWQPEEVAVVDGEENEAAVDAGSTGDPSETDGGETT